MEGVGCLFPLSLVNSIFLQKNPDHYTEEEEETLKNTRIAFKMRSHNANAFIATNKAVRSNITRVSKESETTVKKNNPTKGKEWHMTNKLNKTSKAQGTNSVCDTIAYHHIANIFYPQSTGNKRLEHGEPRRDFIKQKHVKDVE